MSSFFCLLSALSFVDCSYFLTVPPYGVNMSLGLSMSKTETSPKTVVGHTSHPISLSVFLLANTLSPVLHFLFSYSFLHLLSARFVVRLSLKSVTASISMVGCVSALIHHLNQMDRCHLLLKVGLHTQFSFIQSISIRTLRSV